MPHADDMLELRRYVDERIDELSRRQYSQSFVNSTAGRLGDLEDSKREILEEAGHIERRLETLESYTNGMGQHFAMLLSDTEALRHQMGNQYAAPAHATSEEIEKLREGCESRLNDNAERFAVLESHRTPVHREVAQENLRLWAELDRLRSLLHLDEGEDGEEVIRTLFDNVPKLNAANEEIRRLRRQVKLEVKDEAELAAYGSALLAEELHALSIENDRLQKELDELLGTEFFKTGERLRRGAAGIVAADLTRILLDERADFWLRMIVERVRAEFGDPASQAAVAGLLRWRSEINHWCDTHLTPAAIREGDAVSISESGVLKRADMCDQWGETRMFDNSGSLLDEHRPSASADLTRLLNDKRAFGDRLADAIETVRVVFPHPPAKVIRALGDLAAWLFELAKWRNKHLPSPTSTEE